MTTKHNTLDRPVQHVYHEVYGWGIIISHVKEYTQTPFFCRFTNEGRTEHHWLNRESLIFQQPFLKVA